MKLSDYTRTAVLERPEHEESGAASVAAALPGAQHVVRAGAVAGELSQELRHRVRNALYEEVSSERLSQLAALERESARAELAALLDQIINERGIPVGTGEQRARLIDETLDMVLGLGPLERLLEDPSITEVMVNGPGCVFFERAGVLHPSSERFASEEQLRLVVDRIISPLGRRVDEQSPIVNARLPQGHRVNAIIPPVAVDGTALTIRKFRKESYSLDELVENGTLEVQMAQLLKWAVAARKNMAVSGGTGGGKTTLLNALSREIPHEERVITIEDSAELRFDHHPHVVRLEARMANAEGCGSVEIRELVTNALRMRPDRIIVGECRGAEALDMLQAMNTGHDGSLTTLHANSPAEVVPRLVMMVRYGMDLPAQIIEMQIASALDMVVQQDRVAGGARRITQIVARDVRDSLALGEEPALFSPVVTWDRRSGRYRWDSVPCWVDDLPYLGLATAKEVRAWEQSLHVCF